MSGITSASGTALFPSTQPTQPHPRVFVAANGVALPVFVDSNGVTNNRPKLIRTLRNAGAVICTDVSRARIILVDPGTDEGRQFVRDWGLDPGKAILNYVWAYHCVDAGRALLENDNYGGFGDLDGTPLDGDHEDEDKQEGPSTSQSRRSTAAKPKKPLPQLKMTPRDSASSSSSSSTLPTPSPSMSTPRQVPPAFLSLQSPQTMHSPHTSGQYAVTNNQIPRQYSTPPASASPMIPPYFSKPIRPSSTTPTTQVYEGHSYQTTPAMQPPSQPPQIPQTPNSFEMALAGSQPYVNPMQHQLMNLMSNPELMSAAMSMLQQQMVNTGSINGMNSMNSIIATPIPFNPSQTWPPLPPPMGSAQTPPILPPPISPAQQYLQSPLLTESSHTQLAELERFASPSVSVKTEPDSQPPLCIAEPTRRLSESPTITDDGRITPSHSSKRRSSDSSLLSGSISKKAKRDGQHKSSSLSHVVRSKEHRKRSSHNGPIELEIETLTPQEPKQTQIMATGVFTGYNGKPIPFFVQVDMRNRVHVTGSIKKNGGVITPHLEEAAYIILTSQSKSTKALMKDVKSLKRHALQQDFVKACVEQGVIVDEADYILAPELTPFQRRKLEQQNTSNRSVSEQSTLRPSSTQPPGMSSRSPTPPTSVEELADGRVKFTPEEKEYLKIYATYAFRCQPNIALHSLARRIQERVPSHSVASWQTVIYNGREDLELIREEIMSEKRRADEIQADEAKVEDAIAPVDPIAANSARMEEETTMDTDTDAGSAAVSTPNVSREITETDVEVDLKTIVNFFVDEKDSRKSGYDDAQLWAKLESEYDCRTASTWQDFYEAHMQEVNDLLLMALNGIPQVEE